MSDLRDGRTGRTGMRTLGVGGDVVANRNYNEHGGCYRSEDAEDSIRQGLFQVKKKIRVPPITIILRPLPVALHAKDGL